MHAFIRYISIHQAGAIKLPYDLNLLPLSLSLSLSMLNISPLGLRECLQKQTKLDKRGHVLSGWGICGGQKFRRVGGTRGIRVLGVMGKGGGGVMVSLLRHK